MTLSSLLDRLTHGPLLADGAMGTELHQRGIPIDACFDVVNLTRPDFVQDIHENYIRAGADLLETNTFGANRFRLGNHALAHRVVEINRAGVELARAAIESVGRPDVLIAGSVGPLGARLAPYGRVLPEAAREAFAEQISALAEAGADLILIETMSDLYEVKEALQAAREHAPGLPVLVSLTFTRDDRTLMGQSAHYVAHELEKLGVDIIGLNCSSGPSQLLRLLRQMRRTAPTARFSVMPNAGWPEQVEGRVMYPATPDYFGQYAREFLNAGACIVGGCCGTTPDHIAAMRTALDTTPTTPLDLTVLPQDAPDSNINEPALQPTALSQKLTDPHGPLVFTVEMSPPKGYTAHKVLRGAEMLAAAGADAINVADSPLARMRMSAWAICHLIQTEINLETVLHFPLRGRNLLRIQGDLLAAHALNVRNVFVVMGDPTAIGDYPDAMDNYDLVPTGLLKLINQQFNQGLDHGGERISSRTSFFTGAALSLTPPDLEREITLTQRKLRNGAGFFLTQPVFNVAAARTFFEQYEATTGHSLEAPVVVGVLPLYSERHATFLHNEVPGVTISEEYMRRIQQAADARAEGIQIALELIHELRETTPARGIYLMPPFSRYDIAAEIIETVRAVAPA